jgi:hypothetical protein
MNQMHGAYNISNADKLYVLCAFVVMPIRWIDKYGWRRLTQAERTASANYYREPAHWERDLATGALRLRALTVRFLPARKEPLYARQLPNVRSYPQGYDVARLGTFPPGCPMPYAELLPGGVPVVPTRAGLDVQRFRGRGGRSRGGAGTTREEPAQGSLETALPPPRPSVFRHVSAPSLGRSYYRPVYQHSAAERGGLYAASGEVRRS